VYQKSDSVVPNFVSSLTM